MLERDEALRDEKRMSETLDLVIGPVSEARPGFTAFHLRAGIRNLLCFIVLFLVVVQGIFRYHAWNFEWMPKNLGIVTFFFFFLFNATIGPLLILSLEVITEINRFRLNEPSRIPSALLKNFLDKYLTTYLLDGAVAYTLVYVTCISYTNLKPAIPLLNTSLYDDLLFKSDTWLFCSSTFPHNLTLTACFDAVYFLLWPLACLTLLITHRDKIVFWRYTSAWCLAFGLSMPVSILFPTLGPAFLKPELFGYISGTHSDAVMKGLLYHYQAFKMAPLETPIVASNGIVGMPSLHLALAYLASTALREIFPRLRVVMWAMTLLFLIVTVYLGWHYLLDGIVGIGLGWIAYRISTRWFPKIVS